MYKILIVEDDMMIAKTLSSHLEKWDYEVRYVKDFKNVMNDFAGFDGACRKNCDKRRVDDGTLGERCFCG